MATKTTRAGKLPQHFLKFRQQHPEIHRACEQLGLAIQAAGPLDQRTRALVQLGIAIGARQEGGVHSHTRRAREAGAAPEAIRHAVLLALQTVGFPNMMAALSWVDDVLEKR